MSPLRGRIHVVDDKENMRHLLVAILRDHTVEAAADGKAALALITRDRYDLCSPMFGCRAPTVSRCSVTSTRSHPERR
jgi:CheY-like chemotaxis protein